MKTIKSILMSIALLFSGSAMAQVISASQITIASNGIADLDVIYEQTDEALTGAQFSITLPTGLDITYDADEAFDYVYETPQKGYSVNINDKDGYYVVVMTRKNNKVSALTSATTLIKLNLTSKDAAEGSAVIKISGVTFAKNGVSVKGNADFEVPVKISSTDGISSISAEETGAAVYNLAGQKVSKAQKGLFIKSGKKFVVK